MRDELCLAQSVVLYDSLPDLLADLDSSIETHTKLNKRYEDRLGLLLREAKDSDDPRLKSVAVDEGKWQESDQPGKKKKDEKKRDPEEKGWLVIESDDVTMRLANGSESLLISSEISLLFKVIESVKARISALESARKLASGLAARGLKSDVGLRVIFRDGLPRYLIPSTERRLEQKKFRYVEQFRLAVLK